MAVFEEDGRPITDFLADLADVQSFGAQLHAAGRIGLDGLIGLYGVAIKSDLPREQGFAAIIQCTACGIADPHVRLYLINTVPSPPLFSTVSAVDYLVRICRAGVFSDDLLDGLLDCSTFRILPERMTSWDEIMRDLDEQRFHQVAEMVNSGTPATLDEMSLSCGEILVETVVRLTRAQIHPH